MQSYVVERRSTRAPLVALAAGLLLALGVAAGPRLAAAQDATPAAEGSRTITCDATASGTPMADGATPVATPAAMDASPAASPAAEFTPTPAGSDASEGMTSTVRTLAECVNAGDYGIAALLLTDNFIRTVLGVGSADEVAAALEGMERMRIRLILTPETYDDGTASVIIVYEGFVNTSGGPVAERWYFVRVDGIWKIDRAEPAELPPGIS